MVFDGRGESAREKGGSRMSRNPEYWGHTNRSELFDRRMSRRTLGKGALAAGAGALAAPVLYNAFNPAAVAAAQRALAQTADSATAAVEAAKQFSGVTLNVVWEDALQLEDPSKFSGPMWEDLTGIKINPIGKPFPELFPSQVAEHIGETGAYDVLSLAPSWTADFVARGIAEPLDDYITQYMNPADLEDYHPL